MYIDFFIYDYHIFQQEGDFMKLGKNMALMGLGAGAVLAYQKYKKPLMKEMNKVMKSTKRKAKDTLEDMME